MKAVLGILLVGCSLLVSGQIQCPSSPATRNVDGTVTYSPLPSGSVPLNASYNPGPVGSWYSLASSFVDAVRPGSLPFDQILTTLNDSGIQCTVGTKENCPNTEPFDSQRTLRSFSTWWIGLIVVTLIGGIAGCAFCVTGMCFCCCRCCGKCGGSKTQNITDHMDCKAFTFAIILLLFILILFAGVVLAFFSNEQTYNSLQDARDTVNEVADVGVNYINDTLNEVSALACQLSSEQGVAGFVIQEAEEFNDTLRQVTGDIERDVDMILQNITVLNPGYNETIAALESVGATTTALVNSGTSLNMTLTNIAASLTTLRDDCAGAATPLDANQCNMIIPDPALVSSGADFNQLPNTTQELSDVRAALDNIDFTSQVQEGRQEFENIRQTIEGTVSDNIDMGVDQLLQINQSLFGVLNNLTAQVESYINNDVDRSQCPSLFDSFANLNLSVGYIRQCIINNGFELIQGYDVYRYAFGIVICSLSLVTIVLMLVGLFCGMVGFRKDCNPEERSGLSHCGGILLVLGTIVTFIFGFVLLVLCCIFFFFGSNARKLCQAVDSENNYPIFSQLVDNREFWGGSLIAHFAAPNNPEAEIYLSEVLNNCAANQGLYSAANLSILIPGGNVSSQIDRLANLDEIQSMLQGALENTTNDFNFSSTSFLPDSAQTALEEFRNASVDQINITAFREQIENPLVSFNITEYIVQLQMLTSNPMLSGLATQINATIMQLESLRDSQIPSIVNQTNQLEMDVNNLVNVTDNVVRNSSDLVTQINSVIVNITGERLPNFLEQNVQGAVGGIFGLLDGYIAHVDAQLTNNIAACRPLFVIYDQIYDTGCRNFLDGLNGFWWSLGFCALLFIPIIIFAVLTSNYFLKKRTGNDDLLEPDYPMKDY